MSDHFTLFAEGKSLGYDLKMQLFVRGLQKNYCVTFDQLSSVKEVLARITAHEAVAKENLAVFCGGRPLENLDQVAENPTLDVCVKLKGGKVTFECDNQ